MNNEFLPNAQASEKSDSEKRPLWSFSAMTAYTDRSLFTAGGILSSMLFMSALSNRSFVSDARVTGIAVTAMLVSSIIAGWFFAGPKDRSVPIGFLVGMPLGFLYFQNSYARLASMHDLARGSATILAMSGILAVISAISAWIWRRRLAKNQI